MTQRERARKKLDELDQLIAQIRARTWLLPAAEAAREELIAEITWLEQRR